MESKVDPKFFFFENTTRLGLVLDRVATAGKIENLNNQANARVSIFIFRLHSIFVEATINIAQIRKAHRFERPAQVRC